MATAANVDSDVTDRGLMSRVRSLGIGLLVLVSVVSTGLYVIVHWMEHQVLNTDNWVALVSPLPKQPVVSTALGTYIGQQVSSGAAVQQRIANALPPQAAFLAAPLASQLNSLTVRTAQKLIASDGFQTVWSGANRLAMNRLLAQARGQPTPLQSKLQEKFNVDISGASGQLRNGLGSAAQALPALQPASHTALTISADLHSRRERVHQAIRTIDAMSSVLPLVIIASLLGALALSAHRRRTAMVGVVSVIVLMLLELIALKWFRQQTLVQVHNSANLSAVGYIYDVVVGSLKHSVYIVLAAMVIAQGLLLAAGPARWAQSLRSLVHVERVRSSRVMATLHSARDWSKRWEHYLWLGAIVAVLIILALFTSVISSRIAINAALVSISLLALLHIAATPHYRLRTGA